ncbi:hypothetical protein C8F04DRAFT_968364 [Mycena alexandri]|uniref:Uncharacterized protein n=1 Tax=Mycena alexandri TaxID=1745969 RepID=A0AAD6SGC6_9AGAR|nr:hypothetical protein C8F04DRAFT_968364 [Mycena alexandri]
MPTDTENFRAKKRWTLSQLISLGFRWIQWDGIQGRPLLDANGRIFAVLAGRPNTPAYAAAIARAFDLLVRAAAARTAARSAPASHRRGLYAAVTIGLSYGQGQRQPSMLRSDHPLLGQQLAADPAFQDIAAFGSAMLAFWAPRLYQYYRSCNSRLDPRLTRPRPFARSVFASATFNLGPHAWTFKHRDILNLPFGWCPVTAFGDFDPTKGGHLVLWDLKLVIEFPPGSTILIPSATLAHSNIPVAKTEYRASFTQYSAGGLFRYVDNDFMTEEELAKSNPETYRENLASKEARWEMGVGLWSTLDELVELAEPVKSA